MGKRQQQQERQRFHGDFMSPQGLVTMTNHHTTTAPAEEIMATMPPLPLPTATTCTSTNPVSMPAGQLSGSREAVSDLFFFMLSMDRSERYRKSYTGIDPVSSVFLISSTKKKLLNYFSLCHFFSFR